jgi:hypothetical protein
MYARMMNLPGLDLDYLADCHGCCSPRSPVVDQAQEQQDRTPSVEKLPLQSYEFCMIQNKIAMKLCIQHSYLFHSPGA